MSKPVMVFKANINHEECSNMMCKYGGVTIVPFTATVESDLFTGKTLPGACDVQTEDPAGCRHMCAKYMFKGVDLAGNKCSLFVENNGYFSAEELKAPCLNACPRFITDSPVLGECLCQQRFRSEVEGRDWGVEVRIYDTK